VALTVDIPLQTLTVGSHTFGPATVPDDLISATLTVDRTVSRGGVDGLNAQPATTTLDIIIEESDDGGVTWGLRAGAGLIGGTYPSNLAGDPYLASTVTVDLNQVPGRRARAVLVVAGARVAVAGTLVVS
jgi:hypothetical protein